MRRLDKQITDQQIIEQILSKSETCRLAIHDAEYPYIVPMNYGYRDGFIYMHGAREGKKIDLLRKNPKVGFAIEYISELVKHDISCKWTTKYRSVIGCGEIEIISDFAEKVKGLDIIMEHFGKYDNAYNEKHVENILMLKLKIIEISGKQSGI